MSHPQTKANASYVNEFVQLGIGQKQAEAALVKFGNNKEQALDYALNSGDQEPDPELQEAIIASQKINPIPAEEEDLSRAIEMSMKDTGMGFGSFEPLNPTDRVRVGGIPVGLKNVGNTCYFNSLLQTYFTIPKFVQAVLSFRPDSSLVRSECVSYRESKSQDVKKASIMLVEQIQKLFAFMIRSHRKYLDPTAVLAALVDDFGNRIQIGDEKDVGEFNMLLISRIEDGLKVGQRDAQVENIRFESLKRKESYTPLQESILLDEGIVTTLFYGKQTEELHFKEATGEPVDMTVNAIFGQVMLDVEERDLYYAWDSACHSQIEEFITPQGFHTSAGQDVWLERLPAILLVQINRVKFDRKSGKAVKLHTKFTYPSVLYPDRFLLKNKELSSTLRTQELDLKRKVKVLETYLAQFEQYKDTSMSLEEVLKFTSAFFEDQLSDREFMQIDDEDLQDITTYNIGKVENLTPDLGAQLRTGKDLLEAYARTVTDKVTEMKTQLNQVTEDISRIYGNPELQQHEYHLHSLLIHDGQAGSGHYYAYSYDEEDEKWWKFNDIHVTEAQEADVLRDGVGGFNYTSAYCLVYLDQRLLKRHEGVKLRSYSLASVDAPPKDEYSQYLTQELLR